jgi:transposase
LEELYNVSHKSVCNWVHRYNSGGLQGLTDRPRAGRPSRLTQGRQDALRQAVSDSPEKQGYSSVTRTGAMLILYIEKLLG